MEVPLALFFNSLQFTSSTATLTALPPPPSRPFHYLENGVSHTDPLGLSHTDPTGVSHTAVEAVEGMTER